ncbi:MAG: lyase family protein [Planctomycetota bacterium]|jgi:adenylosuccinate lyase
MKAMAMFDAVCPLDGRYIGAEEETLREAGPYLSGNAEIRYQLRVECAILRAYGELGILPETDLSVLEGLEDSIPTDEVYREEEKTQHNIRALVNCIQKRLPESLRAFVHLGPTSADVTDTARSLQVKDFTEKVLVPRLVQLERILIRLCRENAATAMVGRTHGQHAVPTTFGHAVALYVSRLGSRIEAIVAASSRLTGKLAGAVGAFNSFSIVHPAGPQEIQKRVMAGLGLHTSPTGVASQIVEPEPITDYACACVSAFSVIANLADDLRNHMRTEIAEIGKVTGKDHVGSSTMPHKVNPKDYENVKSLWKAFMPRIVTVFSDQISEHQRDLTNSASGRFVMELIGGFYYGALRMIRALQKIVVRADVMKKNLESSKETFVAEPLYIVSGMYGIHNGYELVKEMSEKARTEGITLSDVIKRDGWPEAMAKMGEETLSALEKILASPESYQGEAEKVALATADYWEGVMDSMGPGKGEGRE